MYERLPCLEMTEKMKLEAYELCLRLGHSQHDVAAKFCVDHGRISEVIKEIQRRHDPDFRDSDHFD